VVFRLFTFFALLISAPAIAQPVEPTTPPPLTILVSIDGFRADYLDRPVAPRLQALARGGARAAMRPSFPSITFPNHYTLVTGLRPDRNGIIGNSFEDPAKPDVKFSMTSTDPKWWAQAEPLWITAEKAGIATATMFWPGSNVVFNKLRPRDWWTYAKENPEAQRVDAVIDWLRRPAATRPRFVTLYFDTVDTAGHDFGPDDPRTDAAIAKVDTQIGRLVDGVAALGVTANYIIVADHGMARIDPAKAIALWKIVKPRDGRIVYSGAVAAIAPQPGRERQLAKVLLAPHDGMTCMRKADVPARLHYGSNPRVPAFICIADIGQYMLGKEFPADDPFDSLGAHGYDPANREMDALFVANGPAFRAGTTLPAFDNVDVYPLVARLIGITPRASDGDAAVFVPALTAP